MPPSPPIYRSDSGHEAFTGPITNSLNLSTGQEGRIHGENRWLVYVKKHVDAARTTCRLTDGLPKIARHERFGFQPTTGHSRHRVSVIAIIVGTRTPALLVSFGDFSKPIAQSFTFVQADRSCDDLL